jgi:hypothetical protein
MKKVIFLIIVISGIIFYSCKKYEFDEKPQTHKTEIGIKNSQATLTDSDTLPLNSAIIFFAKTLYGNPYTFNWGFGNGDTASGEQVTYKYLEIGEYIVTLSSYDGNNWYTSELNVVIIDEQQYLPVFTLEESKKANSEGKIEYTFKFLKDAVPNPPVPENGPFFYIGNNPESNWNEITVEVANELWCYYSYCSYDTIYDQAFGGMDNENPIWGNVSESVYFDENYGYLRIGLMKKSLVTENQWEKIIPGETGDTGDYPAIRITTSPDSLSIFADVRHYAKEGIHWPGIEYKTDENNRWSTTKKTSFVGGSGYVKYTMARRSEDKYFFQFFGEDKNLQIIGDEKNLQTPIDYSSSVYYSEEKGCLYLEIVDMKK